MTASAFLEKKEEVSFEKNKKKIEKNRNEIRLETLSQKQTERQERQAKEGKTGKERQDRQRKAEGK